MSRSSQFPMPSINIDTVPGITPEEKDILRACLNGTKLRASKPSVDLFDGKAAYLWRMVAWGVSPVPQHHCLPMMADMDLKVDSHLESGVRREMRHTIAKSMDDLAERVESTIPINQRHGTLRWASVMGVV